MNNSLRLNRDSGVPEKLCALIVDGRFSRWRVFGSVQALQKFRNRMVLRWREADPARANQFRAAKILRFTRNRKR